MIVGALVHYIQALGYALDVLDSVNCDLQNTVINPLSRAWTARGHARNMKFKKMWLKSAPD